MSELFYVFGLGLTAMAVIVAFVGLRSEKFPSSRPLYLGVMTVMAVLVVGSGAFAVKLSAEEQEHHAEEYAEYFEEQEALAAEEGEAEAEEEGSAEETAPVEPPEPVTLEITSPEDGSLIFDPDTLEAEAGDVEIDYTNPSAVPHNVAIEAAGETVAQGETVTEGANAAATANLEPGDYIYYCSIPGHREDGMEGTLTVD